MKKEPINNESINKDKTKDKTANLKKKLALIDNLHRIFFVFTIILLLISSISLPSYRSQRKISRKRACAANLRTLEGAVEMFFMDHTFENSDPETRLIFKSDKILLNNESPMGKLLIKGGYMKKIPPCRDNGEYFIKRSSDDSGNKESEKFDTFDYTAVCTIHNTYDNLIDAPAKPEIDKVRKYALKFILSGLLIALLAILRARAFNKIIFYSSAGPLYAGMALSCIAMTSTIIFLKVKFTDNYDLGPMPVIIYLSCYALMIINSLVFYKSKVTYVEECMKSFVKQFILLTLIPGIIAFISSLGLDRGKNNLLLTLLVVFGTTSMLNFFVQPVSNFFNSWKCLLMLNFSEKEK
jgi:competence protein ComGC